MSEENPLNEDPQITFKVKTSSDGNHTITMSESATVLDLKNHLSGPDYENIPSDRQRLIYSGRVMKNDEPLSSYKIKTGNTVHMVKSAQSNTAQSQAGTGASTAAGAARAAPGVPTNMAAGTANNPLAALTGARYAGHLNLPGRDMFGVDGGMGAPPNEEQMADILSDPATAQMVNEALNNPQMIDLMIQSNPTLRQMGPQAREVLQSPMFRQMMTNPDMLRQAAQMRRMMGGGQGGSTFPAPGITDTTPQGAAGTTPTPGQANVQPVNPFAMLGPGAAGNPFAAMFNPTAYGAAPARYPGQSLEPARLPGQASAENPGQGEAAAIPSNPLASLLGPQGGSGASPFANMTPEMMQQALAMFGGGGLGTSMPHNGGTPLGPSSPPPVDTRPPEEMYADQLRQLNDMGFFDFDRNVQALRRSGGSVLGAINQLLG